MKIRPRFGPPCFGQCLPELEQGAMARAYVVPWAVPGIVDSATTISGGNGTTLEQESDQIGAFQLHKFGVL